jgi:uncharacterized protein (DUF1810 family)
LKLIPSFIFQRQSPSKVDIESGPGQSFNCRIVGIQVVFPSGWVRTMTNLSDGFPELSRFRDAQDNPPPGLGGYRSALGELRVGCKAGHWMWYIFPQVRGLGFSERAVRYSIGSLQEAGALLSDPVLGSRLVECTGTTLTHAGKITALQIFGPIDAAKFHASMTLFARVVGVDSPYRRALDGFFDGIDHAETAAILDKWAAQV